MLGPLRRAVFVAGTKVPWGGQGCNSGTAGAGVVIERSTGEFDRGARHPVKVATCPAFPREGTWRSGIGKRSVGSLAAST